MTQVRWKHNRSHLGTQIMKSSLALLSFELEPGVGAEMLAHVIEAGGDPRRSVSFVCVKERPFRSSRKRERGRTPPAAAPLGLSDAPGPAGV